VLPHVEANQATNGGDAVELVEGASIPSPMPRPGTLLTGSGSGGLGWISYPYARKPCASFLLAGK